MAFHHLKCEVCGQPATKLAGKSAFMPICDNVVCEVTILEQVNEMLRELDANQIKFKEFF